MTDQSMQTENPAKSYADIVHGFKQMDIKGKGKKPVPTVAPLEQSPVPTMCKQCKCEQSHYVDLYSNACSLLRKHQDKEVCHSCTHRKPHHFSEYVCCHRCVRKGGVGKSLLITINTDPKPKAAPLSRGQKNVPVGINPQQEKDNDRNTHSNQQSARGLLALMVRSQLK
jgi:hypothetical protein